MTATKTKTAKMTTLEMIQAPTEGKGHATSIPRIPSLLPSALAAATIEAGGEFTMTHEAIMKAFTDGLEAAGMEAVSVSTEEGREVARWFLTERRMRQGLHQRGKRDLPEGQRFLLEADAKTRNGRPAIRISIVANDAA